MSRTDRKRLNSGAGCFVAWNAPHTIKYESERKFAILDAVGAVLHFKELVTYHDCRDQKHAIVRLGRTAAVAEI
jgi:hypothetical protein